MEKIKSWCSSKGIDFDMPIAINSSVSITTQKDFYGIRYNSCKVGHIERINNNKALVNWHFGVAPNEWIDISNIINHSNSNVN